MYTHPVIVFVFVIDQLYCASLRTPLHSAEAALRWQAAAGWPNGAGERPPSPSAGSPALTVWVSLSRGPSAKGPSLTVRAAPPVPGYPAGFPAQF